MSALKIKLYAHTYRDTTVILLHEKFLQSDWLRAVVFQLNLKYLHVKITNLLWEREHAWGRCAVARFVRSVVSVPLRQF